MSVDQTKGNAAKQTTPTREADKAHNSVTASPAKTAGAKVAKKVTPAKAGPSSTAPIADLEPRQAVVGLLIGQIDLENLADLPPDVQALLVTVALEQRRETLFDSNNTYIGVVSFTSLVRQLLDSPPNNRVTVVMSRMRRDGVYTSKGVGRNSEITFVGTKLARDIAREIQEYKKAQGSAALNGPTPGVAASSPPEYAAAGPQPAYAGQGVLDAYVLSDLLVGSIVETVWRMAGYDPYVVGHVVVSLQSRPTK